MISHRS